VGFMYLPMKHLAGRRIPMGGVHYDLAGAIDDLRAVQAETMEAIQSIEPAVPKG